MFHRRDEGSSEALHNDLNRWALEIALSGRFFKPSKIRQALWRGMFMRLHEKYNRTPFAVDFFPCMDERGVQYAVAALKATIHYTEAGDIFIPPREQMLPVFLRDVYWTEGCNNGSGNDGVASLRYPSDISPRKYGTDVLINGFAHAKGQCSIEAAFSVGPLSKSIIVKGQRKWERRLFSETISKPEPFDSIPLRYERAFGGRCEDKDGNMQVFRPNPAGMGFSLEFKEGQSLPNLEFQESPIGSFKDRPTPAGFGPIPTDWEERTAHAGTFDAAWFENRRPLFPDDFNECFYNAAPGDQVSRPKLRGGEVLTLKNIHPEAAVFSIKLPLLTFSTLFRVKNFSERLPMEMDVLLVEPEENRLALTFRSSLEIGNDWHFLKSVHFELDSADVSCLNVKKSAAA